MIRLRDALHPKRIQRRRSKGWRMPEGAVYVGRPTKWGNPFIVGRDGSRTECVEIFRCWLTETNAGRDVLAQAKRELRGKDLCCWCRLDQSCHGDVLLKVINS